MVGLLIALGILVVVVVWGVGIYNRLVQLKNRFQNAFAQIEVQLKRRYDLIPNLVETVKGYAAHERELLEGVAELRALAAANRGSAASQATDENNLQRTSVPGH